MKILQVINFFSPLHGGGSIEVVYQLSKVLIQRGHDVAVYTSDFELDQNYINSLSGVRIYPFHSWLTLARFHLTPGVINTSKKELKNFDVIHLHNYRTFQNIVMHHYAKKYNIPYVLQAHGSLTTFFQKGMLKKIFDTMWGYQILKDASKVIALTPAEAEQYKRMGVSEDKIEIIPNGIDLSEFGNLPERGEFRRKYSLNDNQKIILFLGRIHQTKGLDLLAKAFAQLSNEVKDVKLVIVGPDDGYLPALKELIKELKIEGKVMFTGMLNGTDKLRAYVDADVFVNPRADEIFGLVFLEAFACGLAVICSKGCGLADTINGQAGLVVAYDKDQLSNAISHMLSDDKMRLQFGKKGKLLVREKFNWEKIAGQVEDVYMSCLLSVER